MRPNLGTEKNRLVSMAADVGVGSGSFHLPDAGRGWKLITIRDDEFFSGDRECAQGTRKQKDLGERAGVSGGCAEALWEGWIGRAADALERARVTDASGRLPRADLRAAELRREEVD